LGGDEGATVSVEKEKILYMVGLLVGVIVYALIFVYVYKGNLAYFIKLVIRGRPEDIAVAYLGRVAYLFLEGMIWWSILRMFHRVSLTKVCEVMFAAIFVEFIIPIGGATEVARYLLAVKLKLTDKEGAAASIFAHRLINSAAILITTFTSLVLIGANLGLYIGLGIPALIIFGGNVALYLLPKYKWVERYGDRFLNKVGLSIKGMSENYRFRMSQIRSAYLLLALAFSLAIMERFANALFGIGVAGIIGLNLSIPKSILAFDSLYTVMWLFPVMTPGGIGVFEFFQTGLLTYLGIGVAEAATISIITRIYYIIGDYPFFAVSAFMLGYSGKGLINQLMRARKAEKGMPEDSASKGRSINNS